MSRQPSRAVGMPRRTPGPPDCRSLPRRCRATDPSRRHIRNHLAPAGRPQARAVMSPRRPSSAATPLTRHLARNRLPLPLAPAAHHSPPRRDVSRQRGPSSDARAGRCARTPCHLLEAAQTERPRDLFAPREKKTRMRPKGLRTPRLVMCPRPPRPNSGGPSGSILSGPEPSYPYRVELRRASPVC